MFYKLLIALSMVLLIGCGEVNQATRNEPPASDSTASQAQPEVTQTPTYYTTPPLPATIATIINDPNRHVDDAPPNDGRTTVYPTRLLYPDHADVRQEKHHGGLWRITTFTSDATSDQILTWYQEQMSAAGWEEIHETENSRSFGYSANGPGRPAYGMTVTVEAGSQPTLVYLKYQQSGPFSLDGWPED